MATEGRLLEEPGHELVVFYIVNVLLFQSSLAPTQSEPKFGVHVTGVALLHVSVVLGHLGLWAFLNWRPEKQPRTRPSRWSTKRYFIRIYYDNNNDKLLLLSNNQRADKTSPREVRATRRHTTRNSDWWLLSTQFWILTAECRLASGESGNCPRHGASSSCWKIVRFDEGRRRALSVRTFGSSSCWRCQPKRTATTIEYIILMGIYSV